MKIAVGLPDLHPGKWSPIGAAFASEGWIYPALAGNDIGCGIGLWKTGLSRKKIKREAWADRLRHLDDAWDGDACELLATRGLEAAGFESSLGTIGGGNHFAELQAVKSVEDCAAAGRLCLSEDAVYLCVHSGSRGFGEAILRAHIVEHAGAGLPAASTGGRHYLEEHYRAVRWAAVNRELIARRILERLRTEGGPVVDSCHNSLERCEFGGRECWLHRKGAAPSTAGAVVIPGSRGAASYLVAPRDPGERSAWSLAHGAGRKWSRSDSRGRLEKRFTVRDLERTELGSHVICEDRDLLYEEAPQAYKNIATVVGDLVDHSLADVVAVLEPLVTYKVRR